MSYSILMADNSATTRAILKKALQLAPIGIGEIYEAENGREAVTILERKTVDLVLSGINMPVGGGMAIVETMRETGLLDDVPVVLITMEGRTSRIERLLEQGVRAHIRKPFAPETVSRIVGDLLGRGDGG